MKKALLLIVAAMMVFGTSNCKKDSDDSTTSAPTGFSAKFDGTPWSADVFTASLNPIINYYQITGSKTNTSELITLQLSAETTGTYPISEVVHGSGKIGMTTFMTINPVGSIVITKLDRTANLISGTFSFDAYENSTLHYVTEGKFENVPVVVLKK